jgi:hypothetical protein
VASTIAYYDTATITAVKSFIVQTQGVHLALGVAATDDAGELPLEVVALDGQLVL